MPKKAWTADNIPDQTGLTYLVTGANSGLGLAMTRELARRGAHVVLAVRNPGKGAAALAALRAEQPGATLELRELDLADLDSVRAFAATVIAEGIRAAARPPQGTAGRPGRDGELHVP